MTGSCDDCALLMTWEERYDFEGHGGEMMSECGLEADWGDCTIDENGEARCPECGHIMEDVRDAGDS